MWTNWWNKFLKNKWRTSIDWKIFHKILDYVFIDIIWYKSNVHYLKITKIVKSISTPSIKKWQWWIKIHIESYTCVYIIIGFFFSSSLTWTSSSPISSLSSCQNWNYYIIYIYFFPNHFVEKNSYSCGDSLGRSRINKNKCNQIDRHQVHHCPNKLFKKVY